MIFKIGDKVRLTEARFKEFSGGRGVVDPRRVLTVTRFGGVDSVYLDFPKDQAHDRTHLVLVKKPTIII